MIVYKGILEQLSAAGWSTYRLQKEKIISNGTIIQIRTGKPISTTTIDTICSLLDCQPGDLMEYVPEQQDGE